MIRFNQQPFGTIIFKPDNKLNSKIEKRYKSYKQ